MDQEQAFTHQYAPLISPLLRYCRQLCFLSGEITLRNVPLTDELYVWG
ncbi:hypothetical protein SEHO0A_04154 [Salmonella enterica subsp. houtenae str. ATCC BAA-1581]|nr:hypothetical protein SEHO0A_04154 [Salmonella enterica subsp. houtenae str. ATCC BAA-1581]